MWPVRRLIGSSSLAARRLNEISRIVPTSVALPDTAVAASPISIRPCVEKAFDREYVVIDFFGYSGKTLPGVSQ
jgi:hypothetical protein